MRLNPETGHYEPSPPPKVIKEESKEEPKGNPEPEPKSGN
jgi:hypothetical protein